MTEKGEKEEKNEDKIINNNEKDKSEDGEKENKLEEEEESDEIEFDAMGNNKIVFLSKNELNKIKEKKLLREEYMKREREKINARHKRMYLRKKKRYLKMLEKEKEEENKKDKDNNIIKERKK